MTLKTTYPAGWKFPEEEREQHRRAKAAAEKMAGQDIMASGTSHYYKGKPSELVMTKSGRQLMVRKDLMPKVKAMPPLYVNGLAAQNTMGKALDGLSRADAAMAALRRAI